VPPQAAVLDTGPCGSPGDLPRTLRGFVITQEVAMRSLILRLAPVVAVLGLAACGSSSTPSSPASAASSSTPAASASAAAATGASDGICAQFNTQLNAITPTPPADPQTVSSASDLQPVATWLDKAVPVAIQEQTALNGAADSGPIKSQFGAVIATLQSADAEARGGDPTLFKSAWSNFLAAQNSFQAAATGANMPNCAK
jgi:hypothetical protein